MGSHPWRRLCVPHSHSPLPPASTVQLRAGRSVRLGDLGSFRPTLTSMPSDTEADVSARNIKKVNVVYTPSGALRRTLKSALSAGSLKFQLVKPDEQQEEDGEA